MIVVTTPTGAIGAQVVDALLARGASVRVIVRDAARLPARFRDKVKVVEGSHGDKAVIDAALQGAEAVFWLPPPAFRAHDLDDAYTGFSGPAARAFAAEGVKRVVGVSALGRGTRWEKKAGQVTASLAMDDLIGATGVPYRALVMPSFMDNILRQAEGLRTRGVFASPIAPDRKAPTCATADIAAMAVRLLTDASWTGAGEQPVLGPEDLSPSDMTRIMGEVLGKPLSYSQVPMDAFRSRFVQMGASEAVANGYVQMMTAKDEGMDNVVARTPSASTPTTFRNWCESVLKPAVAG